MLLMHEVHKVKGTKEDEFEATYRDGWMPMLAKGDDARLLWYTNHAHGSGMSYQVVTVTAVRDAEAWARLADRIQAGWAVLRTDSVPIRATDGTVLLAVLVPIDSTDTERLAQRLWITTREEQQNQEAVHA